jgi:hypothetical protein
MTTHNTGVKHDTTEVTPYVGMTGLWSLKTPYNNLIDTKVEYTCISVNNISGMIAQGLDPKKDIYIANGDTEANYLLDQQKNRCIIQLQSGTGVIVTVPNSALNKLPTADGVNYVSLVLGMSLSIIPDSLDLTSLKNKMSDLVLKEIGVKSTVFQSIMGGSIVLDHTKHKQIETARRAIVANNTNTLLQNEQLKEQVLFLSNKVTMLENYIKSNL